MTSKRQSMMPPAPKPPTILSPSLIISEHASLTGHSLIQLGSNTVLHPRTKLSSLYAPITIGSNCILCERSQIGYLSEAGSDEERKEGTSIGDGVVIEVGAVVEGRRIGEGCVVEVGGRVGKGAILGKHCKIGPHCEVAEREVLPDYTVVYGNGMRRLDSSGVEDLKLKMVGRQVDVLRKLIPSNPVKFQ